MDDGVEARARWRSARTAAQQAWDDDLDWDKAVSPHIYWLQRRGDPELVEDLMASLDASQPWERRLAAEVLSQYGYPLGRPFAERATPVVAARLRREPDPEARRALVGALGQCELPHWAPELMHYADDGDAQIRQSVAADLCLLFCGEEPDESVIACLIRLSADPDPAVRDWATFSLGSLCETDNPEVRAALRARLDDDEDPETDTNGEAALGLALRHDPAVIPYLLRWLAAPADVVGNLAVEAAGATDDPQFLPHLRELDEQGWQDDDPRPDTMPEAIARLSAAAEARSGPGAGRPIGG